MYPKICSFENLFLAFQKAAKGKSKKGAVIEFSFHAERHLLRLQEELSQKNWLPHGYKTFQIYDPKERTISAAPFEDRVIHHALCNIIEPVFERTFIHDSYANRKGKGTHNAILRYQQYARKYPYVLKCDIRKFFPSLDHEILKRELRWRIKCPDTLRLADTIIDRSNLQEEAIFYFEGDDLFTPYERRRGLPIGNLTSQFWANVYLNRFDHFVKETLCVPGYIRYVDDFVLFAPDKTCLHQWQKEIENYLARLRLKLHPRKTQVYQVKNGVPFLGFSVFPYYRHVLKAKAHRYRRFLKKKIKHYKKGRFTPQELENALNAWLGHIRFGQSRRLENNTLRSLRNQGINVVKHPSGSWKVLEI